MPKRWRTVFINSDVLVGDIPTYAVETIDASNAAFKTFLQCF